MIVSSHSKRIFLSSPEFCGTELLYIQEAFEAGVIATSGNHIAAFEKKLQSKCGGRWVVALNSGNSAIHLALVLLGVGPGDEVLCQSLTFAASANPISYLGAFPIFVDSEIDTWNICPEHLEDAILDRLSKGKRPKAIICVNLFGMPAQMPAIMEIANRYDIPVVEDAAESLGSRIKSRYCGTFGDLGVYSFNGNKMITTGGGGALVVSQRRWACQARHLSTQAKDNYPYYQHSAIGYNYKMNNLAAGIGIAQLDKLDERVAKRRAIFNYYNTRLKDFAGISLLDELEDYYSNRWLSVIPIDPEVAGVDVETLRISLELQNIESRQVWKPMHLQPVFKDSPCYGGETAARLFENGLCLPSGSDLKEEDLERVLYTMTLLYRKGTSIKV